MVIKLDDRKILRVDHTFGAVMQRHGDWQREAAGIGGVWRRGRRVHGSVALRRQGTLVIRRVSDASRHVYRMYIDRREIVGVQLTPPAVANFFLTQMLPRDLFPVATCSLASAPIRYDTNVECYTCRYVAYSVFCRISHLRL